MTKISLLFVAIFFLLPKNAFCQTGKLQVRIKVLPSLKTFLKNEQIHIDIMGDSTRGPAISTTERDITFDSLGEGKIIIFLSAYIKKLGYIKEYRLTTNTLAVKNDSLTLLTISFPEDCTFNRHSLNSRCPKCKKADRVLPILYGLPVPRFDENGNMIKEYASYSGGCMVSNCDPAWYCRRDKFMF